MTNHALPLIGLVLVLSTQVTHAQTGPGYRSFELGATIASVSTDAKGGVTNAKTIHEHPALIQDVEWRPPYSLVAPGSTSGADPVEQIDFSFYNNQLYQIVITYDHQRTAGMNNTDMIEGISATYGTPSKPSARKAAPARRWDEAHDGLRVAQWDGADQAVVLYRSSDFFGSSTARYWLIVTSPRLDALAQTASTQAIRLEDREAPQRAAAQQKKDASDARAAEEKTRAENKAAFRP